MAFKILVAEDEEITLKHLVAILKGEGYETSGTLNGQDALRMIEGEYFDLLITDIKMPGMGGLELLSIVKSKYPEIEVIIITGFGTIGSAVEAIKNGAIDYLTKPFDLDELIIRVKKIYEQKQLKRENTALKTFLEMDKKAHVI
ncbi:MAG: sigma-54-dependent transcriptional regulator, partial [Dissulfurispiraceae bacterium]